MTRVLIVDDKAEHLYLLRALLQGHGYTVEEARHGAEALLKARQDPPDMIVSDLLMPVMDGYTFLRHCKADARLKRIPFVVYTATYTEPRDERLALDLGADAFILKPAEPDALIARLRQVESAPTVAVPVMSGTQVGDEHVLLKSYSETLIRKLEEKTLQLEEANRVLERDIAERKRAEEKLRQSEERFRELAETVQEAFWITDPVRRLLLYVSPAYEKIWGRSCASLYEAPGSWLDAIHPDDRERIRQAAASKQVRGDYDETYRVLRPDGTLRWVHDRAFPVYDAAGQVVRIIGTAEDITDRRQLEEQFHQSQKMQAIGQLAAGVAHDFNNILAAILGNAQLGLQDTPGTHPARHSLEEISKASVRGKSLVQQILAFTQQQRQERQVIELGQTVQEAVSLLRAIIPSTVEIVITLDAAAPTVLADATQVNQVIVNLCTNAWHALDDQPGRIELKVESVYLDATAAGRLAGMRPGRVACISVTDNGKGMDAATLDCIFDPFFTTKEPDKGTGLGLSVVHGIVRGHDGAIAVDSQPGRGTTFRVYFPAAAPLAQPRAPAPALQQGAGQHILYLDDEEPLVFLAQRMLERLGYRVTGFTRPADAMNAFRAHPAQFDLAITDLNMPGMSGLRVAADLLKLRPDMPVALCSGHVSEELRQQATQVGIRKVLYKPNTMEELSVAIHQLAVGH